MFLPFLHPAKIISLDKIVKAVFLYDKLIKISENQSLTDCSAPAPG